MVVNEGSTADFAGLDYDTNDNTDGFHDFRLVYDSGADAYHYFRDAVQITPLAGIGQQAGTGATRLIVGDCCSGFGGAGNQYEIDYIRFDMAGAFSPAADQGSVTATINRDTGEISFANTSGTSIDNIVGYSILSDAGSLTQTGWNQQAGSSQLASDNDDWTVLSGAGVTTDLSEGILTTSGSGNGGDLVATSGTWTFGNIWQKSQFEDVVIELILDDGSTEGVLLTSAAGDFAVTYSGDAIDPADLDGSGAVDTLDWVAFKAGYETDTSAMTDFDAYRAGDVNLDGVTNQDDFLAYRALFANAGAGSLSLDGTTVPEPATWTLAFIAALALLLRKTSMNWQRQAGLASIALAVILTFAGTPAAQADTLLLYDADPDNNAGTPAPDPTTLGWFVNNLDGNTPDPAFSSAGTTTGGAQAWILNDAGPTGAVPNQSNLLGYVLDPFTIDQMDSGGFTLTMEFEQLSDGAFVGIAYNHDGADDDIGLTANSRYGQSPSAGLQTFTYSWDTTTFTPNADAGGPGGFSNFWGGATPGGGQVFFGDNTRNSAAFNLAITKVTLDGPDINPIDLGVNVDITTGKVTLFGDDVTSLDINSYSLTSDLGQLVPGSLNSLESQGIGDVAMTPNDGIGFEVLGTPSATEIAEGDLTGATAFGNSTNLMLGNIFDTGTAELDRDLAITFTTIGGATFTGDVNYITSVSLPGDFNGDQIVNAADYTTWRDNLGSSNALGGNGDETGGSAGVVDAADYALWKSSFGNTAGSGSGSLAAAAVPEPSSLALLGLLGIAVLGLRQRKGLQLMQVSRTSLAVLAACMFLATSSFASQNDRDYRLGDDGSEGASANNALGAATFDSAGTVGAGDLQDLFVEGSPTYRSVSDRPGALGSDLGVEFDGTGDSLNTGVSVNAPAQMWDNEDFFPGPPPMIFPHNYEGIFGRGMQIWAKPDQTAFGTSKLQSLLFDSLEHGIQITANDTWGLWFDAQAGPSIDSGVSVASTLDGNGWAHAMEVAGFGDRVGGGSAFNGALLVNGVAVATRGGAYDPATQELVIGAQGDGAGVFTNQFDGILDDAKVFFWGDNSGELGQDGAVGGSNTDTAASNGLNADGQNWGALNLAVDNDWIAQELASMGVTDRGDVDLSGGAANAVDETAFITHWRKQQLVGGIQIGDWNSRQEGDLNYDGIVNLRDAFILHDALTASGAGGLDFSLLGGTTVPEPTTVAMSLLGLAGVAMVRRRHKA